MHRSPLPAALLVLGVAQLAQGLWMAVSPGSFFDVLGPFGERNDHYVRDSAAFVLAAGAGLVVAARRASWRVPVLAVTTLWFALHAINHLVDIGEADPEAVGVVDFVLLGAITAGLAWLTAYAHREQAAQERREVVAR